MPTEALRALPRAQALTRFLYGYYVRRFRVRTSPEVCSLKQSDI
jgi:hypothetical protein